MRYLLPTLSLLLCINGSADVFQVGPGEDVRAAIAALRSGDELRLRGGTYTFDSRFNITAVGTRNAPIVIRGTQGESVLIRMTTADENILEVQGSRFLEIRGLRFTGGSHGIRLMDSDFITIESCEVYGTGDVAISANAGGTYEGLRLLRNHIHHTNGSGEGYYLGCNNDRCRVSKSLIEGNHIHDTNRGSVSQGDGIELKEGSYENVIRGNVIHDTKYPGIITYSTAGNGGPNVIEGNVIWATADNAIQSAADAIIRNNIVLDGPIALQPHQAGSPSNHFVVHNTVINDGDAINVRGVVGHIVVANNAVYSRFGRAIRLISGDTSRVTLAGNVGWGGVSGSSSGYVEGNGVYSDFANGHYRGRPPFSVFPVVGSALIATADELYVTDSDFNGTLRGGSRDVGAYRFTAEGNPGWPVSSDFKPSGANVVLMFPEDIHAN